MKFKYKASSSKGVEQTGNIEANSKRRAIELLQKHKLVVISIKKIQEITFFNRFFSFLHRVKTKKKVIFFKELSVLLSSGVSLAESLIILYSQEDNIYFKKQIFKISNMVSDGVPFSVALSKFPGIFPDFFVNIIKSGETSGKMQEELLQLSSHVERQYLLNAKIKSALMYPAIVTGGFVVIGIGMMAFVVPQLVSIFQGSGQELPLPTKILIFVSNFMNHYIILIVIAIFFLWYIIKQYIQTSGGKLTIDVLALKIPYFSSIFQKFYVARFAENFSLLISSGVPIIDALQISGDIVGNGVYKKIIYNSVDEVKMGGAVAYAFERSDQFPSLVSKMMMVGEKTGKLDSVLDDLAKFYAKEVDISVDGLTTIIEPIMIFILGGAVAILVASILLPIYQMTTVI